MANRAKDHKAIRWILLQLTHEWRALIVGSIFMFAATGLTLLIPQMLRIYFGSSPGSIDLASAAASSSRTDLFEAGIAFVLILTLLAVCTYVRALFFGTIGHRIVNRVRRDLFAKLIFLPVPFFDRNRTTDLVTRISTDVVVLQDLLSIRIAVLIRYGVQVLLGTLLMVVLSPKLAACVAVVVPILVFVSMYLGRRLRALTRKHQEQIAAASSVAEEDFSFIRAVKAFGTETFEESRFKSANNQILASGIQRTKLASFFQAFASLLLHLALVAVAIYGMLLVDEQRLDPADLAAFLMYGGIVGISFTFVAMSMSEAYQALGVCERIIELLAEEHADPGSLTNGANVIKEGSALPAIPTRLAGGGALLTLPAETPLEAKLEDVYFSYSSRPDIPALAGVSLEIPAGKMTAVVGPSGAGKSTLVNLVLGFYKPNSGRILLDGIDLQQINSVELRKSMALVPQEPMLFAGTLEDNLTYGSGIDKLDEALSICERLGLSDFIRNLPAGPKTLVGERGLQLSAGQRQRVALVRAILRKPRFLILDEATSALDSESESMIQGALRNLLRGITVLAIAHRLSTVKDAHQVVVMRGGKIVERGDHTSLIKQNGLYRLFVEHQDLGLERTKVQIAGTVW